MPTAKSYQDLEKIGKPYKKNGKDYIIVRLKNGAEKEVRWYSDSEFARLYPEETKPANMHDILGFRDKGFITIFKVDGDEEDFYSWFTEHHFRRCGWWSWFVNEDIELPEKFPVGVEPLRLSWSLVGNADGTLKSADVVKCAVHRLRYGEPVSKYVGNVGDRDDFRLTVTNVIATPSQYGVNYFYVMKDQEQNEFVWSTSSKKLQKDTTYNLRGTIKAQKLYKGVPQTVLTRCTLLP